MPFSCSGGSPVLTALLLLIGSSGRGLVRYQNRTAAGRPAGSFAHRDAPESWSAAQSK